MKKVYFTVGPSQVYPSIYEYMAEGFKSDILSISHTSKDFADLYRKTSNNLKKLFNIPESFHIFFTGSSTESMERIISNTVRNSSIHLINGGFAQKFYKTAVDLHKTPVAIKIPLDKKIDFLSIGIPKDTELLCITENETSTGMRIPLEAFRFVKKNNPNLLIAVDIVSSVPYVEIDYSLIDLAFFSLQKGFGMPAGMGVLIVNETAIEKARTLSMEGFMIGSHHSFLSLAEKEKNFKNPATPNVFYIYLFEKIINDLLIRGIHNVRRETKEKAEMIYEFFGNHKTYKPLVYSEYRSVTTPVINVHHNAEKIAARLAEKGLIISTGYGVNKDHHIRIANFPSITKEHVAHLLAALE